MGKSQSLMLGEFRRIASAFVSFDGVEDLTAFIRIFPALSQRYG